MQGMMGNMPAGGMWGMGMMFISVILWVGLFALIIAALVYLIRYLQKGGVQTAPTKDTPLEILKRRYASGEIDKEEFDKRKRDLA